MKRFKPNTHRDRKTFTRTSKTHPANTGNYVMRGGKRM